MLFLSSLVPGECGIVEKIEENCSIKARLYDLGIVPGTKILCVMRSPLGDPIAYYVRGTLIALRFQDSSRISVNKPVTM